VKKCFIISIDRSRIKPTRGLFNSRVECVKLAIEDVLCRRQQYQDTEATIESEWPLLSDQYKMSLEQITLHMLGDD